MKPPSLLIPRPQPPAGGWVDEDEFELLVRSIETLLFTSTERPTARESAVLATALAELEARWPEAAAELAPRIAARRRRCD